MSRFGDRCFKGTNDLVKWFLRGNDLRVKASLTSDCGTGKIDVRCGLCHDVLIKSVSSFLLSPEFTPETGEVTVLHFDDEFDTSNLMENEDGALVCGNHHGEEIKIGWGFHHKTSDRRRNTELTSPHLPVQRGYEWTCCPGKSMQCYFENVK